MSVFTLFKTKRITFEATVKRTNGQIEHLGVVAFYDINPLMRLLFWLASFERLAFIRKFIKFKIGA